MNATPTSANAQPGVGSSLSAHWFLVALCVLVFVGAGAAAGLLRSPVYTARAKLSVGQLDLAAPGALAGYAQASQALASGYARAIDALAVVDPVARRANLSVDTVRSRLSASPVPESPVFRVEATGPHEADAVRLANLGSSALASYVSDLGRTDPDTSLIYEQFRAAAKDANAHRATERRVAKAIQSTKNPPSQLRDALVQSKTAVDTAALRAQGLRQAYVASLASRASSQRPQLLAPASSASSDRRSKLEILMFAGLVAGLLVGTVLASMRDGRARRRAVA